MIQKVIDYIKSIGYIPDTNEIMWTLDKRHIRIEGDIFHIYYGDKALRKKVFEGKINNISEFNLIINLTTNENRESKFRSIKGRVNRFIRERLYIKP